MCVSFWRRVCFNFSFWAVLRVIRIRNRCWWHVVWVTLLLLIFWVQSICVHPFWSFQVVLFHRTVWKRWVWLHRRRWWWFDWGDGVVILWGCCIFIPGGEWKSRSILPFYYCYKWIWIMESFWEASKYKYRSESRAVLFETFAFFNYWFQKAFHLRTGRVEA